MSDTASHLIQLSTLVAGQHRFDISQSDAPIEVLTRDLGLLSLTKLSFRGSLDQEGRRWTLKADLGASVTQACIINLAPVKTRIDTQLTRVFSPDAPQMSAPEMEMPEDPNHEPVPEVLDLHEVLTESLSLALPDYPRAIEAELAQNEARPKGAAPLPEKNNPFSGLAELKKQMDGAKKPE